MFLSIVILFMMLGYLFVSHKEELKEECPVILRGFHKAAVRLSGSSFFRKIFSKTVCEDMKQLCVEINREAAQKAYYVKKIRTFFLVITVGSLLVFLTGISNLSQESVLKGNKILRNDYGEDEIQIELEAQGQTIKKKFTYEIEERKYSKEDTECLFVEMETPLAEKIKGKNSNLNEVRTDLDLVTSLKDYPVKISWESGNYKLLGGNGEVNNELLEETGLGETVTLTAILTYEDYQKEIPFYVTILPLQYTEEELFLKHIMEAIQKADLEQSLAQEFYLPENIGEPVSFREVRKDDSNILLAIVLLCGVMMFFLSDKDLHKQVEIRKRKLELEYPEFVSRLSLLVSSGATVKGAFQKLIENYENDMEVSRKKEEKKKKEKIVYEELKVTMHEIENGIFEETAYDNFGKRCKLGLYIKLAALLNQNMKKGTRDIVGILEKEATDAFEIRKSNAKKLGEEAGTKLLLPMMLMLGIVMVLIMVPAFFSYQI